jgi:malate dehydrogenase
VASPAPVDTVRNITQPSGEIFSAAIPAPAEGSYGVPQGIVFGYPLRASASGGVQIEPGIVHNDWAQARVDATLAELLEEREAVMELIG